MADPIQLIEFNDVQTIEGLDKILGTLTQIEAEGVKIGKTLDDAFAQPTAALGVADAVKQIKKEYEDLRRSAIVLRDAIKNSTDPNALKVYKAALDDLEKGMKDLSTIAKTAGVNLKEVNKEAGTGKQVAENFFGAFTKAALITGAIEQVVKFTKYAVELAEGNDRAARSFEGFLGSAEEARGVVADLTAFANKKLLNTQDILDAGKGLLAFGEDADNLTKVLDRVADISAATGKNFNELVTIYGKARTSGVLYAEDINQLVDAGIPIIQEFAKQMGVSTDQVKKLASEGKISFEELQLAFFNLTKEGSKFAGQAELGALTVKGAYQRLVNELQPITKEIGDFFSFFFQDLLNKASSFISDVRGLFSDSKPIKLNAELADKAALDADRREYEAALNEQEKLEQAAAKRRAELNAKSSGDRKKQLEKERDNLAQLAKDIDRLRVEVQEGGIERDLAEVEKKYNDLAAITAKGIKTLMDIEKRRKLSPGELAELKELGDISVQLEARRLEALLAVTVEYAEKDIDAELASRDRKAKLEKEDKERLVKKIEDQRKLGDQEVDFIEAQGETVIRKLESSNAKESVVRQAKADLDELIQQKRLENEIAFNRRLLEVETDPTRVSEILATIRTLEEKLRGLDFGANSKGDKPKPLSIYDLLGIEDPELRGGIDKVVGEIIGALDDITKANIEAAQRRTEARQKEVDDAENFLKEQQNLAKEGLRNDASLAQQQLEQKKIARDKAFVEEQKTRKLQLVLDTAEQASGLITASVNIFRSLSKPFPAVGIPLAIGLISAMLGAFVVAKAKAFSLINQDKPKLRQGKRISGKDHESGGEPHMGVDGVTYEVENLEYVIGTKQSKKHDRFLNRMLKGHFDNVDLNYLVTNGVRHENQLSAPARRIVQIEQDTRNAEAGHQHSAMVAASEMAADRIVKAIGEKAEYAPWKNGYRKVSRKGNTKTVETVLPSD